jgi:hypothetical protein
MLVAALVMSLMGQTLAARWQPVWAHHIPARYNTFNFVPTCSFLGRDGQGNVFVAGISSAPVMCLSNLCWTGPTNFVVCLNPAGQVISASGYPIAALSMASGLGAVHVLQANCEVRTIAATGEVTRFKAANLRGSASRQSPQIAVDESDRFYFAAVDDQMDGFAQPPGTNSYAPFSCGFVTRFDTNREIDQVITVGSNLSSITAMNVGKDGSVYIAGKFPNTFQGMPPYATFGTGTNMQSLAAPAGTNHLFLACFAEDGSLKWVKETTDARFTSLAITLNDEILAAGEIRTPTTFAPGVVFGPTGLSDGVLVKYTLEGDFLWARQLGGAGRETWRRVASSTRERVFVAGEITANAFIEGSGRSTALSVVEPSAPDIVAGEFGGDGTFLSATSGGGQRGQWQTDVVCADDGSPIILCTFDKELSAFGTNIIANRAGATTLEFDYVVAKLQKVPAIESVKQMPEGVELIISGPSGASVVLEQSSDLASWTGLWTNSFSDIEISVVRQPRTNSFYRLRLP